MAHKNKDELSFKCQQCNIYFEMKEELRIHSFIHFDGEIKSCPVCDQIFKTTRLLNVHLQKHQDKKSFKCTDCGDFFTFKTGLAKHIRLNRCRGPPDSTSSHTTEGDQKLASFINEEVARSQLASITRPRQTAKARKRFETAQVKKAKPVKTRKLTENLSVQETMTEGNPTDNLRTDKATQPPPEVNLKETRKARTQTFVINSRPGRAHLFYTCDLCGFKVKFVKNIKAHMKLHVSQDKLQCKICSDGFRNRSTLSEHMLLGHGIKTTVLIEKYTCEVCAAKFDTRSRYEAHKLSHDESARNFNCNWCSAAFKTVGNLHRHEATHAESRDFHCDKCSKSFKTKIALNVHTSSVHVEYNVLVECPICRKLVKEKNFSFHRKMHSEDSNLKPFVCTICLKTFKTQKLGLRHYGAVHDPKDRGVVYSCPDCPEKFLRLRDLKNHSFSHFSGPIFQCESCKKVFKTARLLRIHVKSIHENAETLFSCGQCESVMKTRSGLVKHVKSRHSDINVEPNC